MSTVLGYIRHPRTRESIPDVETQVRLVRERADALGLTLDEVLVENARSRSQPLFLRPVGHRLADLPAGSQIISPIMVSPDPVDAENVIRAWGSRGIAFHFRQDEAWHAVDCADGKQSPRMLDVLHRGWSMRTVRARTQDVRRAAIMEFIDALYRMSRNDRPR